MMAGAGIGEYYHDELSEDILAEAGIKVRQFRAPEWKDFERYLVGLPEF